MNSEAVMPLGLSAGFVFVIGCCFGSFLNVCIWRMPRGESVVTAPSHCPDCNYRIRWYENIPLLSYLALRGRCSNCRKRITPRYFGVELLTGTLFLLYYLKFPEPLLLIPAGALIMLSITTVFIDIEHRIIPDATTYPAMLAALAGALLIGDMRLTPLLLCAAVGAATATALSLFALAGRWIFRRDALGWGDVKFVTAAAMLLDSAAGAFFVMFFGAFTGALFGAVYALVKKRSLRRTAIAFGPFLAAGAMLWLFFGDEILSWYLETVSRFIQIQDMPNG